MAVTVSDDDIIRFISAGTETWSIEGRRLISNIGKSIYIGKNTGINDDGQNRLNVFIGNDAGAQSYEGYFNVYLGDRAGMKATTGSNNVYVGAESGLNNLEGDNNTYVGREAGFFHNRKFQHLPWSPGRFSGRQWS